MKLDDDDFRLFDIPQTFDVDPALLDQRWRALQRQVHPDRFAAEGDAAQRVAMQWAVRVNEAYRRLKDPLKRAAYLCELRGSPIDAESNTAMPAAFLQKQMAWRESLDDAADEAQVRALADDVARTESRVDAFAAAPAGCAARRRSRQRGGARADVRLAFSQRRRRSPRGSDAMSAGFIGRRTH